MAMVVKNPLERIESKCPPEGRTYPTTARDLDSARLNAYIFNGLVESHRSPKDR